jgi:ABC-type Fe3+ transport system substrate-binding protein
MLFDVRKHSYLIRIFSWGLLLSWILGSALRANAQSSWEQEWQQVQALARKEGKVVVNIPPSTELRSALEKAFPNKFGIQIEIGVGQGAEIARRVATEFKAGVRYFDVITATYITGSRSLLPIDAVEPMERSWILPEVKDPKKWWGGHIWGDKTAQFFYYPAAFTVDNLWYNSDKIEPGNVRSYDDLLNPKWKGQIGLFDPRLGGAGLALCSYLWMTKGEAFLTKLINQQLLIGDRRTVADSLAKGKISMTIGATYYSFLPFIKAGLPVKPFPALKEGTYATAGNGGPVLIKNAPHPNAAKVFVNWFFSKEGQELYDKAFGNATRRMDVDTGWLKEFGVQAAKDFMSVDEYNKNELSSEEKIHKVRLPTQEFLRKALP